MPETPATAAAPAAAYNPRNTPQEVQAEISTLGIRKANTRPWQLFLLALLAGIYISFGGHVFLVAMEQGLGRVIGGLVFSIGLVFVVIAGAELFTGNVTMVIGTLTGHFSFRRMLRNWIVVYAGNLLGAYLFAWLIAQAGLFGPADAPNALGQFASRVADQKLAIPFGAAFIRGIFCNILVILAILLSYFAKDVVSKIACCMFPIMVFVVSGYEHCIANMYLIPAGLFAHGASLAEHLSIYRNILPVTLGNIVGGIFILLIHPNRIRQIATLVQMRSAGRGTRP